MNWLKLLLACCLKWVGSELADGPKSSPQSCLNSLLASCLLPAADFQEVQPMSSMECCLLPAGVAEVDWLMFLLKGLMQSWDGRLLQAETMQLGHRRPSLGSCLLPDEAMQLG